MRYNRNSLSMWILGVWGLLCLPLMGQEVVYINVAGSRGISHTYNGNFLGGGVSFCDFDGDGLEDLSLTTGPGAPLALYHNTGSGFTDISGQFNLADLGESETILWADYDNDGDKDLLVVNFFDVTRLYRNDSDTALVEITLAAGLSADSLPSTAACWGDFDNDGWLDLLIANYSYINGVGEVPNILYRNNGDGSFTDVTATAGVADSTKQPLAAIFVDYDNDGWQDIYLANDKRNGNTLFHNNGDGTFSDVSAASGAGLAMDAMGLAVGDYDNNGYPDLYVSNGEEGNALLRNNGDGTFTNVAEALGVAVHRICRGANFLDYDNDGDLDLYVSVSGGIPDRENPLFRNNGDGTFTRVTGAMQGGDNFQSYGNAVGDFNNDGYCDIAVLNEVDLFVLWENQGGFGNNWIKLSLRGTVSNRDGIGAVIMIHTAGGLRFFRSVHCGQSYLSQNSAVHTIGVGPDSTVDVAIYWPSGAVDVLREVPVNQHLTVVETTHRVNNVAPFVGIDHTYEHRVPESLGGGAAFCDYDNDGREDLILATGLNEPVALYRNQGRYFRYVTPGSGITDTGENKSLIWGDFDNDGWPDLFITNFEQSNRLYRNLGNGRFADYTAQAGLPADTLQSTAAAWVDYDNDGWLDLYIANYGNAHGHGDEPNLLYRNNGDGTFSDVTQQAGLAGEPNTKPLALAFFDYDNDGWPDLYICMDKGQRSSLYHNNGDGTFSDVTAASGTGAHIDAMGIAVADYDRDGFLDFYITNGPPGNRFYRNNGDGTFTEMAVQAGVAVNRECWGTAFSDFDNDGIMDLFVAVGAGTNREDALFRGDGVAFTDISHQVGIMDASLGYGFAVADVDNDGGLDMVVVNRQFAGGERTYLYKNSLNRGNWLKVKTVGVTGNASGIGARVRVVIGGQTQIQEVSGGSSYLSQHSQTLHFGLGTATMADSVIVRWPSGVVDVLTNVPANQRLVVTEGSTVGIGEAPSLPAGFFLSQNYPNPFNPVTNVEFRLVNSGWVTLKIYDILGREIKTLVNGRKAAGRYTVQWDGTNHAGQPVASGVYLYRLSISSLEGNSLLNPPSRGENRGVSQTRKMVLLR